MSFITVRMGNRMLIHLSHFTISLNVSHIVGGLRLGSSTYQSGVPFNVGGRDEIGVLSRDFGAPLPTNLLDANEEVLNIFL